MHGRNSMINNYQSRIHTATTQDSGGDTQPEGGNTRGVQPFSGSNVSDVWRRPNFGCKFKALTDFRESHLERRGLGRVGAVSNRTQSLRRARNDVHCPERIQGNPHHNDRPHGKERSQTPISVMPHQSNRKNGEHETNGHGGRASRWLSITYHPWAARPST